MNDKDKKPDSESEAFSDSRELFNTLFGQKKSPGPSPTPEEKPGPEEKTVPKKTKPPAKTPPAKVSKAKTADTEKTDSDSDAEALSDSKELFDTLFGQKKSPGPSPTPEEKPGPEEKTVPKKTKPPAKTPPAKVSKAKTADTTKKKSLTGSGESFESLLDGAKIEGPSITQGKKPIPEKKAPIKETKPPAEAPPTKESEVKKAVKTAVTAEKKPESAKKPSPKKEKPLDDALSKKPEAKKVQPPKKESEIKKETVSAKKLKPTKKTPDKDKEPTPKKREETLPQGKPGKRLNPLIIALSVVVLVIIGGLAIQFFGIVDFKELLGGSKPADKVVTPLNVKKKIQKKSISKRKPKPLPVKQKVETKKKIVKTQKATQTKETTSDLKQKPLEERKKPPVTDKVIPDQKPPKVEEPSKPTVPLVAKKEPPKKIPDIKKKASSYPYSIYLGSFSSIESFQKVLPDYREMGLSPYWVKLDLGDKGIWYRLYSDYFKTRREADAFIKAKNIPEAEFRKTSYANLIGAFTSEEALEKKRKALLDLKYSPYVIREDKSTFWLYVGAFYQKARAKKQNADLASKGIQSQLVER